MKPEWKGSIFTGLTALDNNERLALWIIKRGPQRMFFNYWRRVWHVSR
jgi:hypothetical protein